MLLYQQVSEYIHQERLLQPGQSVVAAVSGGSDSLCLLDCLHHLGYPLLVAHLDHQLRPESQDEAQYVKRIAEGYGLETVVGRVNLNREYRTSGSVEERARLARYRFLVQVTAEHRMHFIATGHHAEDQAETILMHLLRGAGPSGLHGMLPTTPLDDWVGIQEGVGMTLVRPLLERTRTEIETHCETVGLKPRSDPSNLDPTYFRNRLRHHLLPILETYNPRIRDILRRMGKVMVGEAELVAMLTGELWPSVLRDGGDGVLVMNVAQFLDQPIALQRGLLRNMISHLTPDLRDVGFDSIQRAQDFIQSSRRGNRQALVGKLEMVHLGEEVVLRHDGREVEFPQYPQLAVKEYQELPLPGQVALANGWVFNITTEKLEPQKKERMMRTKDARVVAFDEDCVEASFGLRPREPGDRIQPLGMQGSTKVADLFINQHIPRLARDRWPLLVAGEAILWVVGQRMSHPHRLTAKSKRAIVVRLIAPTDDR